MPLHARPVLSAAALALAFVVPPAAAREFSGTVSEATAGTLAIRTGASIQVFHLAPGLELPPGVATGTPVTVITNDAETGPFVISGILLHARPDEASGAIHSPAPAEVTGTVVTVGPDRLVRIRLAGGGEAAYRVEGLAAAPPGLAAGAVVRLVPSAVREVHAVELGPAGRTGRIVRLDPGRTLVLETPEGGIVAWALAPDARLDPGLGAGSEVSVDVEPSALGPSRVTRITTTGRDAAGRLETTTRVRRETAAGSITTERTTRLEPEPDAWRSVAAGTVTDYRAGESITIRARDGALETYRLADPDGVAPGLGPGREVVLRLRPPAARSIVLVTPAS